MITHKLVIFTDLDGTLLDRETYSFEPSLPAIRLLKEKGIPLILSSSKTRAEIELYREKLENEHPFISENGGAVFIPKDYFSFPFPYHRKSNGYFVLELGMFYLQIIEVLESIRKETGIAIKGFSDLTSEELSSLCGFGLKEAEFAKKREYDEPFMIEGGGDEVESLKRKIKEKGMNYVWGGRFHHILGKNDKGKAVKILKELYKKSSPAVSSVAIGDSLNDIPMLLAADHPIFLREKQRIAVEIPIRNVQCFEGTGPKAWNDVVISLLRQQRV